MANTKELSLVIPQLALFFVFFGFTMNISALQLMVLDKTCINSGHEESVCKRLHEHPEVEDEIQTKMAPLIQKIMLLSFVPNSFLTLILCPLSDIYGRKKFLLLPVITLVVSTLAFLLQSQQHEISPILIFCVNAVVGLGGGLGTFMSTIISYVTDSTPPEQRTERLSAVIPFLALGQTLSTLLSGIIWEQAGASAMLMMSLIGFLITMVSLLQLEESRTPDPNDSKDHGHRLSIGALFRNATAGWNVLTARRDNGRRRKLLMLMMIGPAAIFFGTADGTVTGLMTRRPPFQWFPSTQSYIGTVKLIANVIGTGLLIPLYNKITGTKTAQGDLTVMLVSYCSAAIICIVKMAATTSSHLLIVPFLCLFVGAVGPATRSLSSKLVTQSESGALNGFMSFLNGITATVGSIALYSLYTSTVHTFPTAAHAVILMVMIGCILTVVMLKRDYREYPETDETAMTKGE